MHQRFLILLLASASCLFGQGLTLKNPGFVASLSKAPAAAVGSVVLVSSNNFTYTGNSPQTVSLTTSGSGRYMTFTVASDEPGALSVSGATYDGVAFTKIVGYTNDSVTSIAVSMWGLVAPNSGTHDFVISFSAAPNNYCISIGMWTGVNQSTPTGAAVFARGNSQTPSVDVTSASGEVVLDVMSTYTGKTISAGAGQTTVANQSNFYPVGSSTEAGASTTTMSWSWPEAAQFWVICAVPLKP